MIERKLALLFPGQGAQKKGMGLELYQNSPYAKQVFDDADFIYNKLGFKFPITDICFNDPNNHLTGDTADTSVIQPALLTYCVATYSHLTNTGMPEPKILLGQSAGKYSGLVASGALDLEEGLTYVTQRGVVMQEAKNDLKATAVVVIGLEYQRIQNILGDLKQRLRMEENEPFFELSGVNTTLQSMLAGPRDRLELVMSTLKESGAKIVSEYKDAPPSHWSSLGPWQEKLNQLRLRINKPRIAVLDDLTNQVLEQIGQIEVSIETHLIGPTFWAQNLRYLKDQGFEDAIEIGPGDTLRNMAKRECPGISVYTTDSWKNIVELQNRFLTQTIN